MIPVMMLVLVTLIQFALWAHAEQVAQVAASEGDRVARIFGSGPAAGASRAEAVLSGSGSGLSGSRVVVVVLPGGQTRTTVTGTAMTILPGLSLPVSAVQVGPIQEFRGSE